MKKIFVFLVCFFLGMVWVYARPECTGVDDTVWDYVNTTYPSQRENKETEDELVKCCTKPDLSIACDHYRSLDNKYSNDDKKESINVNVNYCNGLKSTFVFIGHIIRLAKILIPIIIIGFGMFDFFKAVTSSKDDEIKKSTRSLLFRCVAGVCIFFLPAVIDLIFGFVDSWGNYESTYQECLKCIWDVGGCG